VSGDVQLRLLELPFNPVELAALPILDRAKAYSDLGLDASQREAAGEAVRLIRRGLYGRAAR
jgi:hypothetical protein